MRWVIILCLALLLPAANSFSQPFQPTASASGNMGFWKVLTAENIEAGRSSIAMFYDRVDRNPGYLAITTTSIGAAIGITSHLEFGAAFEANRRVLVRRQDQLSFGQQALGFFGDRTPGSPPLPEERVAGSSRMPQLRFPPTPAGTLTGAAGYYNLLPFAGLVGEGGGIGQASLALKWNFLSESSGAAIGMAARFHFEIPIRKGIDYLLSHPTGTADLQYGFDAIAGRRIGKAGLNWNIGYRHINQPAHVSIVQLADEVPLGLALNVPNTGRVQFITEATAEIFVGGHTPNTTFGAADPADVTVGFRISVLPELNLSGGYRRPVNQFGGDRNGFVVAAAWTSSR
jgi:hypothetical protein